MKFYINDVPDNNEELLLSEELLNDLNNGDYILHKDLNSARMEAKLYIAEVWMQTNRPIFTYKIEINDNNNLISIEKVGELFVAEEDD